MLIECSNCGAPLDAKPGAQKVKCTYCRQTSQLAQTRVVTSSTPQNWQPPQQWTPPPQFRMPSVPMRYNPARAARSTTAFVLIITAVTTLLPLALAFGPQLKGMFWSWDGKEALECGGNDRVTIEGEKVKAKASPAIVVSGNCQLKIINSTISAKRLLEVRGNGNVTIERSKLTATGPQGMLVESNGTVQLEKSSLRVKPSGSRAKVVGIAADGNRNVELIGSTLELFPAYAGGAVLALQVGGNKHVTFKDSRIVFAGPPKPGALQLLQATGNGRLELEGGSVAAGKRKLKVDSSRPVTIQGTAIDGKLQVTGRGQVVAE